ILASLNGIISSISFTMEESVDNSIAFLDLHIAVSNGDFVTKVYRKPTHSGKYLHFDSYSSVSHQKSVVKTLFKRAETHCSTKGLQKEEEKKIYSDLKNCGYSNRFIQ